MFVIHKKRPESTDGNKRALRTAVLIMLNINFFDDMSGNFENLREKIKFYMRVFLYLCWKRINLLLLLF